MSVKNSFNGISILKWPDYDLIARLNEGFGLDIKDKAEDCGQFVVVGYSQDLQNVMKLGKIPICFGNRWTDIGPNLPFRNGQTGFYSNNLDEMRWLIKMLLEKQKAN